jgi:hypothetical protein
MDQSLAVERHVSLETGVRHDLLVDRVALRAGSVDDPGEDHDLVEDNVLAIMRENLERLWRGESELLNQII